MEYSDNDRRIFRIPLINRCPLYLHYSMKIPVVKEKNIYRYIFILIKI